MNIRTHDLNLLLLFKVLYEELNLTKAAQRLHLSQPALSHQLNKLRKEFGDPLFVRAARGLTATPKAQWLAAEVLAVVSQVEQFYQNAQSPELQRLQRQIQIYSTDYIEQLVLPELLPVLAKEAPLLQLVFRNTQGQLPKTELERGDCDLAIAGFYQDLPATLFQQKLQQERFVVLMSSSHPLAREKEISVDSYCQARHLMTTLTGDLNGLVDQALAILGLKRQVVAGLSSFMTPATLLQGTDLLLTCLESIAVKACDTNAALQMRACPVELPQIQVSQIWHSRTQGDVALAWLRRQIHQLLTNQPQKNRVRP
ncbi:LysR family transcriptional regulator [Rheinheimera sp.]|uniref:LysR family transcriptional regulator n=1 Tax=Rheinheimera sp. TaxID=1869214 RepID=UPI00307E4520